MKTVKIRNLVIGGGKPKVCVPMMGDEEAVLLSLIHIFKVVNDYVFTELEKIKKEKQK